MMGFNMMICQCSRITNCVGLMSAICSGSKFETCLIMFVVGLVF
jgi:predicted histidine transporter YuiF (NhaC family)